MSEELYGITLKLEDISDELLDQHFKNFSKDRELKIIAKTVHRNFSPENQKYRRYTYSEQF